MKVRLTESEFCDILRNAINETLDEINALSMVKSINKDTNNRLDNGEKTYWGHRTYADGTHVDYPRRYNDKRRKGYEMEMTAMERIVDENQQKIEFEGTNNVGGLALISFKLAQIRELKSNFADLFGIARYNRTQTWACGLRIKFGEGNNYTCEYRYEGKGSKGSWVGVTPKKSTKELLDNLVEELRANA